MSTDPGLPEEKQFINQFMSIKLKQFDVMVHDKCSRLHHSISRLECVINIMLGKEDNATL